ncbi:MAG: hypothetical protein SFW62_00515 [Alphaproteobacteria bacterium]|nr:hypothetical protein [Alphaproteobacteria bacterium]
MSLSASPKSPPSSPPDQDPAARILAELHKVLQAAEPDGLKIRRLWVTQAYIRGTILATLLRNTIGPHVYSGPFRGMELTQAVMSGAYGPALTGLYEHELHATFERVIAHPYKNILNIGCAFGYYSVGLAQRMPDVKMHSFDIKPFEQQRCRDMAILNKVQDRVRIGGEFRGEDFASYASEETLVLMDIEGAEMNLLSPTRYEALARMDIIVELHDILVPGISKTVCERFAATHEIEIIHNKPTLFDFEAVTGPGVYMDPFDSLIITWESRDGPTPWGVMRARQRPGS